MDYKKIEQRALFKAFLQRIGFKNYAEYIKLFGEDIEKRKIAAKRFLETYQHVKGQQTNS